jgi:hypothetical protein
MFQLPAEDRLRAWRDFRNSLESLPIEQALAQTAEFWARAPFVPYYLDIDVSEDWPDPWSLIIENSYCDIAKCLGIVYTMLLSVHRKDLTVEIRFYEDPKTKYGYNLAWFNQGKYILNLIDGEIVNIKQFDETLNLKKQFSEAQLQIENY